MAGPADPGGFAFRADVPCEYSGQTSHGRSPKFDCAIGPHDVVKVKFGGTNGEVYGEVLSTRLLWALGFGADHMYPVRVICRKCPKQLVTMGDTGPGKSAIENGETLIFDPAAIERKMPGKEFPASNGWSWRELDSVDEQRGGATAAQRDAFKLLAAFLQHTDTKAVNQRLVCLGGWHPNSTAACGQPFMLINDLGLTFGRANANNSNSTGGVNLTEWSRTSVWKEGPKCIGNLPASRTGTLDYPIISEAGRQFLADLLVQLSNSQIRDLFTVSRVTLRLRSPDRVSSGYATVDEWVEAFKHKRDEIVNRHCA